MLLIQNSTVSHITLCVCVCVPLAAAAAVNALAVDKFLLLAPVSALAVS